MANTTTETDLMTITTFGQGELGSDNGLSVTVDLAMDNATAGSVDYTFRCYLGVTELMEVVATLAAGTDRVARLQFDLVGKNSDAIQEFFAMHNLDGSVESEYGSATEDATTGLDIRLTVDMDTASASATVTLRRAYADQI